MSTRELWLEEGLASLREHGPPGVRIDRLARRLGLSKGSFHHHFDGFAGYKLALLKFYEERQLEALCLVGDGMRSLPPREALIALPDHMDQWLDQSLNSAMRAWSFQDPDVAEVCGQLDSAGLRLLESLWTRVLDDAARVRAAALIPHLVIIGSSVVGRQVAVADLKHAFELLAELVPSVR